MKKIAASLGFLFFIHTACDGQTTRRNFADVNGDGLLDKIEYRAYPENLIDIIVSPGADGGAYGAPFTFSSHLDRGYPDEPWGFADVNGDGKADFITIRGTPEHLEQVTYFSNGSGLDFEHRSFLPYNRGAITLIACPTVKVTGLLDPTNHDPNRYFQRGMSSYVHGGNSPESWVRGKATLNQESGILSITVQLETDAANAGPKGRVTAVLNDCSGKKIASITTDEVETGGKAPGSAKIVNFSSQVQIDPVKACKVCSIYVTAQKKPVSNRGGSIVWATSLKRLSTSS